MVADVCRYQEKLIFGTILLLRRSILVKHAQLLNILSRLANILENSTKI